MSSTGEFFRAIGRGLMVRAQKFGGGTLTNPGQWMVDMFGGGETASGVSVTPNNATQIAAVFCAVRLISQSLASLPLKVYRRVGERKRIEAVNHPLFQLLSTAPNRQQTSMEFREMLQGHLCLRGNAYAFIDYAVSGSIKGLIPMHPDQMETKTTKDGEIYYEYTRLNGVREQFRADEILHLKAFSLDGITGISPIREHRETLGASWAAEQYGASFFGNGTHIGSVITSKKQLGDKAKENIAKSFEIAKGVSKAGKNIVLDEGMEYHRLGMTAQDAQYLETRKFNVSEISRMFNVPPHLLGDLSRSTNNNIETQSAEFVKYCLNPWIQRWDQRLALALLRPQERGEYYVKHNEKGFLKGDSLTQARVLQIKRQNGIINANEWRELDDLNPRDDEGGEEFFTPGNMLAEGIDVTPTATNTEGNE